MPSGSGPSLTCGEGGSVRPVGAAGLAGRCRFCLAEKGDQRGQQARRVWHMGTDFALRRRVISEVSLQNGRRECQKKPTPSLCREVEVCGICESSVMKRLRAGTVVSCES
jgi:hypothetical protein